MYLLPHEQTYKSSLYVYYLVGVACLGSFFTGYQIGVFNSSQRAVREVMEIDESNKAAFEGFFTSLIPLGGALGAYLSHNLLALYSRKQSLLITDLIAVVGSLLSMCIFSIYLFAIGRFACGFACGLNSSLISLYVMEVAPIQLRQRASTLPAFMLNIGTFAAYCTGLLFWKSIYSQGILATIYGIPTFFPLLRYILLRFFMKADSPFFYINRGEVFKAKRALKFIYKEEYIEQVYHDYYQSFIEQQKSLFNLPASSTHSYYRRLFISVSAMFFLNFVGASAIVYYSTKIFKAATNQNEILSYKLTAIIGVSSIVCSFASGSLSENYGRKWMLQIGMYGQIVITLSLSLLSLIDVHDGVTETPRYLQILQAINVIAARSYIAATFEANVLAYSSDICCERGNSIAFMSYWLFSGTIGLSFPAAMQTFGLSVCFGFFFLVSILGAFFVNKYVKETAGLTRTEICYIFDPQFEDQMQPMKIYRMHSLGEFISERTSGIGGGGAVLDRNNNNGRTVKEQELTNLSIIYSVTEPW